MFEAEREREGIRSKIAAVIHRSRFVMESEILYRERARNKCSKIDGNEKPVDTAFSLSFLSHEEIFIRKIIGRT